MLFWIRGLRGGFGRPPFFFMGGLGKIRTPMPPHHLMLAAYPIMGYIH